MTTFVKSSRTLALGLACGLGLSAAALAQPLDRVVGEGEAKAAEGRASQARIDAIVDAQQQKLVTYRALLKQIEGLEQYNEQLGIQIQGQEALIERFDDSIRQVATIERQMLPLIIRMSDSLSSFVELDMPFHEAERLQRLAFVESAIARADISVAEKFRQVIEAYQVENEYGRKIDTWSDIVEIDGERREVDILRVGRIAMVAQTRDARTTAAWDQASQSWQTLPAADYRNSVRRGIQMARKQASIDLVTLPIAAPEVAK